MMKIRFALVNICFRLARLLEQLPVAILSPDQLTIFSKTNYSKQNIVASWSDKEVLRSGLFPPEQKGINSIPIRCGSFLLLGVGGGREVLPLARMGYQITVVDFVEAMVNAAICNAREHDLVITGMVQSLSDLSLSPKTYDIAWLSSGMYSCIPSRKKRVQLLRSIKEGLKPGGYFYCEFHFDFVKTYNRLDECIKKAAALVTMGNVAYEKGDTIWAGFEFLHRFSDREQLFQEFREAGFSIVYADFPDGSVKGSALLHAH